MKKLITILLFALAFKAEAQNFPQAAVYPVQTVRRVATVEAFTIKDSASGAPLAVPGGYISGGAGKQVARLGITFSSTTLGYTVASIASESGGNKVDSITTKTSKVKFSFIDSAANGTGGSDRCWVFGYKIMPSGADTIYVWVASAYNVRIRVVNWSGVNQTTPHGTVVKGYQSFGTSVTTTPSVATGDSAWNICAYWRSQAPLSANTPTMNNYGANIDNGSSNYSLMTTTGHGNGTPTQTFTSGGSGVMTLMSFAIKHN